MSRLDSAVSTTPAAQAVEVRDRRRSELRWWREVLIASAFYAAYSTSRDLQGSAAVSTARALANARRVIHLERTLHVFIERSLQQAVLPLHPAIVVANAFYGIAHFVVTAAVVVILYRRAPDRYRVWRSALGALTALALIGFTLFPLLPPRLLPASYGFVDTLARYPTPWSFHSGPVQTLSNQFAAMPSLHFAWALWATFASRPVLRRRWLGVAALLYPLATALVVIVTANHYLADLAAGALTVVAGCLLAVGWRRVPVWLTRRVVAET